MLTQKNKITMRQLYIIFMVSTLSPAIRLFPTLCAKLGKVAGWTAPILSAVPLLLLCMILGAMFKKKNITNLSDVFNLSLGKILGKTLLTCYLLWSMILYFLYIRYYGERLLSTIFPNTDIRFFIFSMMIIVYMAARGRIEVFARYTELTFLMFTVVFVVFFILLISNVKMSNLLPITYYDILPVAKATYPVLGIWGYITLLLFLGEHVIDKHQIKKQSKKVVIFLTVMTTFILLFVIGSMGYTVTQRMEIPFFNATKLITVMETLDRLESVLLSVWVISDFIVITMFAIIIANMTKSLFNVSESRYFASPIVLLGYFGSQFLVSNRFEFALFSSTMGLPVNIIICFVIPFIVFCIGKLRKKI